MASLLKLPNPRVGYPSIVNTVRDAGGVAAPRGRTTREMNDVTLEFESPFPALPTETGRNLSERIAAMEAWQLVGGFSDAEWVLKHAPQFARYTDPDPDDSDAGDNTTPPQRYFHGAYGFRIDDQLRHVARKLTADPESRQAVINLWDQYYDNQPGKHDYPCTVAIGFALRRDELNMRVVMRSNDVWLGLPYDTFQFAQLQATLANVLDVACGSYIHHVWSLHLYASDADMVDTLHYPHKLGREQPRGFGLAGEAAEEVMAHAYAMHYRPDDLASQPRTPSERWYVDRT